MFGSKKAKILKFSPTSTRKGKFLANYGQFLDQLGVLSENSEGEGKQFFKTLHKYYSKKSDNCNSDPVVLSHAVISPLWGEIMFTAFGHARPEDYSKLMDIIGQMEKSAIEVVKHHE